MVNPLLGQTGSTIAFPLPTNVPVGTSIRIGGSSGMETINQALKQRFEQRFVGTKVALNTQGTGPAIKDLMDNNADLAAIGRTLMPQEKAQGLVAVPVSRHKIAIIVGAENPFKGGLTLEQFAKIFRGEIKDWAQVGGEPGPIRFIDRPGSSDTRQAFRNYPVFKQAPFATGKTAQQLGQDSTSQVIEALKVSGIGYAIADQLKDHSDVRIVPINNTLPSNPKYPFSQPLIYVYKGPQPNLPAQAFLGYAAAPVSRQTIETARKEATAMTTNSETASPSPQVTIPSPQPVSSDAPAVPSTVALSPSVNGDTDEPIKSWLWLLALPLLGSFVWWVLKNRDAESEPAEPELEEDVDEGFLPPTVDPIPTAERLPANAPIVPMADVVAPLLGAIQPASNSRLILVPRDCRNAYAYWEIPAEIHASLQQQGAQKLVIRLYDVTGIDIRRQPPQSLQEFDCEAQAQDRHLPIRTDDRMYLVELGYIAAEGRWLQVARSESVHVPACPLTQKAIAPDAASDEIPVGNVVLADGTLVAEGAASPVIAVDRGDLYASADDSQFALEPYASNALQTGEMAQTRAWYDDTAATSLTAGTVANKGEAMNGMVWHRSLDIVSETPDSSERPEPVFATSALADQTIADSPQPTSQSQLILIPRAAQALYVYWEADQAEKDALKQQGGQQMVLRVYAATGTGNAFPQSVQQYFCNDWDHDQQVSVPVSNLEYIAELGYMTLDGRFLMLARSTPTWVPGA
jgi:ABC-type phosphate transport system substrate-binding protein